MVELNPCEFVSIRGSKSFTVASGQVSIPVYASTFGGYTSFTVAWSIAGKRQRQKFSDATEARRFAETLAERLANNRASATTLTFAQVTEYLEAKRLAPDVSLVEVARDHARRRQLASAPTVAVAIADFLAFKRAMPRRRPLHAEYLRNLEQRLTVFAGEFRCRLDQLTAPEVQQWINQLPGSLRTKNNYFADLRMLVTHAIRQRWLPAEFDELARVQLERAGPGRIQPYTPEEAAQILRYCQRHDPRWLPWLPVRMFSGIRSEESLRLTPDHFHSTGWIACGPDITKTEHRRLIPILPNLKRWLEAYPPADVLPPATDPNSVTPWLTKVIQAAGVANRHNGFRDSFASYRLAMVQDAAKVAEETGHDPRQLRRSYREIRLPDSRIITPALARRYFRLGPKSV